MHKILHGKSKKWRIYDGEEKTRRGEGKDVFCGVFAEDLCFATYLFRIIVVP